jgi:hypothetical protein
MRMKKRTMRTSHLRKRRRIRMKKMQRKKQEHQLRAWEKIKSKQKILLSREIRFLRLRVRTSRRD